MTIVPAAERDALVPSRPKRVHRHALATRVTHWINGLCVTLLLMSGLQILLAHPALYWGQFGADADRPAFEIGSETGQDGGRRGYVHIGSAALDTTGALGVVSDGAGGASERAFPRWATIPGWRSLSLGRRWHFFFAWVFVANLAAYYGFGLIVIRRHGQNHRRFRPGNSQVDDVGN